MAKRNHHERKETGGWKTSLTRPQSENLDSFWEGSVGPSVIHDYICLNVNRRGGEFVAYGES